MGEYKIDISGKESLLELIQAAQNSNLILNREPNAVLLSEELGTQFLHETGVYNIDEDPPKTIEDLIGATVFGMDIIIVKNKGYDYIEALEILK